MIISANGLVFNEYSDVLLIQRDDTRTLAPPGGACEINELPTLAAAREVKEETGLQVLAVRLVGLYYLPTRPQPFLFLCFRCIQRGGKLTTSPESPRTGYFKMKPLSGPMLSMHREQIERAFSHSGGAPYWSEHRISPQLRAGNFVLNHLIYPWLQLRRSRRGLPDYIPPPDWKVTTALIARNKSGGILWQKKDSDDGWILPTSAATSNIPPWTMAANTIKTTVQRNIRLQTLKGIYLRQGQAEMNFVFTSEDIEEEKYSSRENIAFFPPGQEPPNLDPAHRIIATDVLGQSDQIAYKVLA